MFRVEALWIYTTETDIGLVSVCQSCCWDFAKASEAAARINDNYNDLAELVSEGAIKHYSLTHHTEFVK